MLICRSDAVSSVRGDRLPYRPGVSPTARGWSLTRALATIGGSANPAHRGTDASRQHMAELIYELSFKGAASEPLAVLALALLCYAAAVELGGNGFVAAFVGGLAFGATREATADAIEFASQAGELLAIAVWFVFGAIAVPVLDGAPWSVAAFAVLALTIGRMLPVAVALTGTGMSRPTVAHRRCRTGAPANGRRRLDRGQHQQRLDHRLLILGRPRRRASFTPTRVMRAHQTDGLPGRRPRHHQESLPREHAHLRIRDGERPEDLPAVAEPGGGVAQRWPGRSTDDGMPRRRGRPRWCSWQRSRRWRSARLWCGWGIGG